MLYQQGTAHTSSHKLQVSEDREGGGKGRRASHIGMNLSIAVTILPLGARVLFRHKAQMLQRWESVTFSLGA